MSTQPKITYHCSQCDSKNVTSDALAKWVEDLQIWQLSTTLQNTDCEDCGAETQLIERPLETEALIPAAQPEQNSGRAKSIARIDQFRAQIGQDYEQPRDMLADLMHWCAANAIDFDHELSVATDFFGEERPSTST